MPAVKKQEPQGLKKLPAKQAAPTNGVVMSESFAADDILSQLHDLTTHSGGGIKVSLYGSAKTGKTRLISSFPKPIMIIGTEDGTKSLGPMKDVKFVLIKEPEQVQRLAEHAVQMGFQTVALDTASRLADLILARILGLDTIPEQKSWGMAQREQYGQQGVQMKTLMRCLLDLPLNVVITAHERNFKEDSTGPGSELLMPTVGSALSPSIAGWLNGAVDYVCQCYKRQKYEDQQFTICGEVQTTRVMVQGVEYCLRVGPHPVYQTGFRLPPGFELPDSIVNPDYTKIMEVIRGKYVNK